MQNVFEKLTYTAIQINWPFFIAKTLILYIPQHCLYSFVSWPTLANCVDQFLPGGAEGRRGASIIQLLVNGASRSCSNTLTRCSHSRVKHMSAHLQTFQDRKFKLLTCLTCLTCLQCCTLQC